MRPFIFQVVVYSLLLWLLNWGVGQYLRTYETRDLVETGQFFPALRWQEYYQRKDSIDLVILGSSHAYRSYDPKVIGQAMGLENRVFNFGSSAQSPMVSFFVLKEILEIQRPKYVVMDLYYLVFQEDNQLRNRRYNLDYMQSGPTRTAFFRDGFSVEEKVLLTAFPTLVYKDYLKPKFNKLLGRPHMLKKKGNYQGAGFVSNPDTLSMEKLKYQNQFDYFDTEISAITDSNLGYLKKIYDLCHRENISLFFITAPMPEISTGKIEDYWLFSRLFFETTVQLQSPFIDYNINRFGAIKDTDHYYDDDHLNAAGARIFSASVADYIEKRK